MRPLAILTCNQHPDYLFLLPIVCKSWELQGFDVELAITGHPTAKMGVVADHLNPIGVNMYSDLGDIASANPALYTQCLRLYMPALAKPDRYCILSDADMFIGSSFLYRDFDKVNVFGWDLTGRGQVPICYVGMYAKTWDAVMDYELCGLEEDLAMYAQKDSADWYKSWGADQDILTGKLFAYGQQHWHQIPRGNDPRNSGLPLGRWDRHNWQMPTGEIHDVHLMREPTSEANMQRIRDMVNLIYPKADWSWIEEYHAKFTEAI